MFSRRRSKKMRLEARRLRVESLEERIVMSSAAIVGAPITAAAPAAVQTPTAFMTDQEWVQSLTYQQFNLLTPVQIQYLTPAQVTTIPNSGYFEGIAAPSRAALNATQVQALNVSAVGIGLLTTQQVGYLTNAQVRSLPSWEFPYLSPTQIPLLTTTQVGSIPSSSAFGALSAEARAALTPVQVQALNVAAVRIHRLTPTQVSWLSLPQIQSLQNLDFAYLGPTQVPYLTPVQISTISSSSAFGAWTTEARAALTYSQVQALNVAAVRINRLTTTQITWLSVPQIQSLIEIDLLYLRPYQIQHVSVTQIASLTSWHTLNTWTPEQRAALTSTQVRALQGDALRLTMLTSTQVNYLRIAQIQAVQAVDLQFLNPAQIQYLTKPQIRGIASSNAFALWSSGSRAALSQAQVQWLDVAVVRINGLTSTQINWLTLTQMAELTSIDFEYLTPSQVPNLRPRQIGQISTSADLRNWSPESRAALTYDQVRSLSVVDLRINRLTSQQISWLRTWQVEALNYVDFEFLQSWQIPKLTLQQFSTIPYAGVLRQLPDASRAALTTAQLVNLPGDVLADYTFAPLPPADYHPAEHMPIGPDGIPIAQHLTDEANRFFALVPVHTATHTAVASGNWNAVSTWASGVVPTVGAKVVIPAGITVRFNAYMNGAIDWLRIDGALEFAVDQNTQLKVDTVVVTTAGRLHIGTAQNPIQNHVTARILIADGGPINVTRDPYKLGRGLLSRGEVRMHGKVVTPYVSVAVNPSAGDTTLYLASVPTNWRVGDRIVVSGTIPTRADFGAEEVQILAINGSQVTIDPLQYYHFAPDGYDLSVHVTNLSRNIVFDAEDSTVVAERPHMVFFHNSNVAIENIGVYGFGRTDKSELINDPVVVSGVLQSGTGLNPRARYPIHFHHTSVNPILNPASIKGSVVDGSPGWAYVNHSSNVNFDNNVAYNVVGASFVTEDGNEIGAMRNNLSVNAIGTFNYPDARPNHDFGFAGNGFWLQGPGVEMSNNISAGSLGSGFFVFTLTSKTLFDAVNLDDPSMAAGNVAIPVGMVPLKGFTGNTAYAGRAGLEIWNHLLMTNEANSYIDDFTSWGMRKSAIDVHYSGRITVLNSTLIGNVDLPAEIGIATNDFTHDLTVLDSTVIGFHVGVLAPVVGSTVIDGVHFAAIKAIYIAKGFDTIRTVSVTGAVTFATLNATQRQGETQYDVYATGAFDLEDFAGSNSTALFSRDSIVIAIDGRPRMDMFYYEQHLAYVPFPSATMRGFVQDEYLDKPNYALESEFGISFAGGIVLPGSATQLPRMFGYIRYTT